MSEKPRRTVWYVVGSIGAAALIWFVRLHG